MTHFFTSIFLAFTSSLLISQTNFAGFQANNNRQSQIYAPKENQFLPVINAKTTSGGFQGRYKPYFALPLAHNYVIGASDADYTNYVIPVFCDSTTTAKFNNSNPAVILDMYPGMSFDPKSVIYSPGNTQPLVTNNDSYYLDTVWIGGTYQRRGNTIDDTLIVDVVWADTANLNVFNRFYYNSMPIQSWGTYINPFYSTSVSHGDKIKYSAPLTNRMRIKHVLTKTDSIKSLTTDFIAIPINGAIGQLIPAGNIVNCAYTFNAGGTHTNGAISTAYGSGTVGVTTSGYAGLMTQQVNPPLSGVSSYIDGYDDFGFGKNYSTNISKAQRYGMTSGLFSNTTGNSVVEGFWIDFSIHANNTSVGMEHISGINAVLGQNIPNPYTKESVVKYTLDKDFNTATFTVTDIMGRVVSSEKAATTTGTHSIKLGTFAAGVYYYSLSVDGNVTTKKMIVE
ncbi:MAG: T9SS type A sorting domain-containing protein [Bacteroidota bacterium]